jgi:hypothetical protein
MNEILTNGSEIKFRIIEEINKSRRIICLAMAFFTDRDIANAIIGAKKRNVAVDIILSSNAQNETVKQMFKDEDVSIHAFETGDERGMMHHKFCLIDDNITINGSYNYSYNASNNNVENIHISDDYSIYKQFLNEFEKLKYNIEHNISVNDNSIISKKMDQPQTINNQSQIDSFSNQLYNIVYLSAQIDIDEYKKLGYTKSKENNGSVEIFKSEFNNLKEQIRLFKLDDSLNSKKNTLLSSIQAAYENKKEDVQFEKEADLKIIKNNFELEKKQINEKIQKLKSEKLLIETGNQITEERGLFQINKEIENNKLEVKNLEESFSVIKFWNLGTILSSIFLIICFFYLSVFFSSAIYKMFFEWDIMEAQSKIGIIQKPPIIDANAIFKLFDLQGTLFGIIGIFIFLFPLALTNLKILGSKDEKINKRSFYIGLIVFDIIVSSIVTINSDKISALRTGKESIVQIWDILLNGEFYLIFIFGMLPLFITHYLIELLSNAYKKSKKELLDFEKTKKLQILNKESIELNFEKQNLTNKIDSLNEKIQEIDNEFILLENELNEKVNSLETKYNLLTKQVKEIIDDYNTKVTSGKIFTDVILNSIISSFKTGFIVFLPELYSEQEVAVRVKEIENEIIKNN